MIREFLLIVLFLSLTGCVIEAPAKPGDGRYAPVVAEMPVPEPNHAGSLYNGGTSVSLFTDRKAHRVGDVLFISLVEKTTSTKSQKTSVKKDNDVSLPQASLLGHPLKFNGNDASVSALAQDRKFDGDTSADQSNKLMGDISVTVNKVYPNGNLFVAGEKWITLSTGDEFVRISGIVRPEDISPDNILASNRLADARIAYGGEGQLADANKMGWLGRFFNSEYWPF